MTREYTKLETGENVKEAELLDKSKLDSQHGSAKTVFLQSLTSFVIVALLVLTWVLMSEMLQDNEWITEHTLAVRACVTGCYVVVLIPAQLLERCFGYRRPVERRRRSQGFFRRALLFMIPTSLLGMYGCGYVWYLSLKQTTAALNASLYQSQCVFVYFFSILFLRDPVVGRKILAIGVSLTGVAFISFGGAGHGNEKQKNTVAGIILTILSAILFASYEVATKYIEHRVYDKKFIIRDSLYWLGYNGLIICLVSPPFLLLCHYTGWEKFHLPDREATMILLELMGFDLIFNALLVIGIAVANPFLISIGMLLVIPASFVADHILGKLTKTPNHMQIGGTILVGLGFIILKVRLCGACTKREVIKGEERSRFAIFNTPLLGRASRQDRSDNDTLLTKNEGIVTPLSDL